MKLKNFFYKDSRLTIKRKTDSLPDGGLKKTIEVDMLTFSPQQQQTFLLKTGGDQAQMSGTYGLNPWDIFNPFKETSNLAWILMYQQGLIKDVTAQIIHPNFGSIMVTVNNPQVGIPYAVFYKNPLDIVIPSPLVGDRINLKEGDNVMWSNGSGLEVQVIRNGDSDCKEFLIII